LSRVPVTAGRVCVVFAAALAFAEGTALGNYQFLKYLKAKKDNKNSLEKIFV
jgi:hypothetical protein